MRRLIRLEDVLAIIDKRTVKGKLQVAREVLKLPTIEPERTGRWINHVEDGYVECPFCHSATNCDDNISELHFCFSCGARMEETDESD